MQGLGPNDPARRSHHGGGLLTPAVLRLMGAMNNGDEPEDCEAVYDGGSVWVGYHHTFRIDTLRKALQLCALTNVSDEGSGTERFVLNEVGRAIIADPSQADVVVRNLATQTNMTVRDGKVVTLD